MSGPWDRDWGAGPTQQSEGPWNRNWGAGPGNSSLVESVGTDDTDDQRAARGFGQSTYMDGLQGQARGDLVEEYTGRTIHGDIARAAGAGLVRGAAGLVDLPGQAMRGIENLGQYLGSRAVGYSHAGAVDIAQAQGEGSIPAPPEIARPAAEAALGGEFVNYQGDTRAARIAGTAAEFVPGAMSMGGGLGAAVRYGAVPGAVSEIAGQAAEYFAPDRPGVEAVARVAGAVATPLVTTPRTASAAQTAGATADQRQLGQTLLDHGVRPTAGQVARSAGLMRLEGRVEAAGDQLVDFTRAAMRTLGSDAATAGPSALRAARDEIVQAMDDALAGVTVSVPTRAAQVADDVAMRYVERVPAGQLTPRIRGIADEITALATNPNGQNTISAAQLRGWRSDLGAFTTRDDDATRMAAHELRRLIDQMTDDAMRAAGREADITALEAARVQYRNFLGVQDAITRAGGQAGELRPGPLYQAILRTQGRESVALQRGTTELEELARAGSYTLAPLPSVNPGGWRGLAPLAATTFSGVAAGSYLTPSNPILGGAIGAASGAMAPLVRNMTMRAAPVQNALMAPGEQGVNMLRPLPGVAID